MLHAPRKPICARIHGLPKLDHKCVCVLQSLHNNLKIARRLGASHNVTVILG